MTPADITQALVRPETITIAAWAVIWLGLFLTRRIWWAKRALRPGHLVHIQAPPVVDPHGGEALWRHLTAALATRGWRRLLWGRPHVVFEYFWTGRDLDVRVWVPTEMTAEAVARAVRAAWPGAATTITTADTPIPIEAVARAGSIYLGPDTGPLATGHRLEPLRALLEAADGAAEHERAVVQILARPATRSRVAKLRQRLATGVGASPGTAGMMLDLIDPTTGSSRSPKPLSASAKSRERVGGAMVEIAVRYAAATTISDASRPTRHRLGTRAARLAAAIGVFAGPSGIRRYRLANTRILNNRVYLGNGRLVNLEELAGLAHLPTDEITPQLARAGARPVAPVSAVPSGGRGTKPLGTAITGRKVAVTAADARQHLHVVGSTGVGKSTLLTHLVLSDIRARRGVVVIDPKGDLVADVLDRLEPNEVADRLHLIDPDQPGSTGIDPLAGTDPDLVADHFVGICRRIWERHWGPRADDILRSGLLTLLAGRRPRLDALAPLLSNKQLRSQITADMTGPLAQFWDWYDGLAPGIQSQAVGPVLSRIRAMMTRAFVRDTIGAPGRDVNMRRILDKGGILLARLPKGQLGDDTSRLLGSVLVARTWQAASARIGQPETRRKDASLYVDECHNFLTLPRSLDEILAEARGFRLSLVLAHQHMQQLPRDMQAAISANARTKIFFTASPEDARALARHTLPHLTEHDLAHLGAYTAACRTINAGRQLPAFTVATTPPTEPVGRQRKIRDAIAASADGAVSVAVTAPDTVAVTDPGAQPPPQPPGPVTVKSQHTSDTGDW